MGHNIKVQDLTTKEVFVVPKGEDRHIVTANDGTKIRLHPLIISMCVKVKEAFDGHTTRGPRPMVRIC